MPSCYTCITYDDIQVYLSVLAVVSYFGGAGFHINQGWWWFDVLVVPLEGFAPYTRHITTKMLNKRGVICGSNMI